MRVCIVDDVKRLACGVHCRRPNANVVSIIPDCIIADV